MNSNIKHKIFIIALFVLLFVSLIMVDTYALFETNGSADSELDVGKWKIMLNGNDVALTETVSINNFRYVNGSHTQSGYFAPGSNAYFDIIIDASQSDVSVQYDLSIDDSAIADYPNIYFSYYDLSTDDTVVDTDYSGIIRLSESNVPTTIRVYITWDNQTAYDELDTSLIDGELSFTINADFKQYIG